MRAVLAALVIGATLVPANAQQMWMRMDGRRSSGDPVLEQEFYAAKYKCLSEANAAANSIPPVGGGTSIQMQQQIQIGPPSPIHVNPPRTNPNLGLILGEAARRRIPSTPCSRRA